MGGLGGGTAEDPLHCPQPPGAGHPQRRGLLSARQVLPGTSLHPGCSQHLLRTHARHQMEGQECRGPQAPSGASLPGMGRAEGEQGICVERLSLTLSPCGLCLQINPVAFGALLQYLYTGEPWVWVGRGCSTPRRGFGATFSLLGLIPWGAGWFQLPPGLGFPTHRGALLVCPGSCRTRVVGRGTAAGQPRAPSGSEPPPSPAPIPRLPGRRCGACRRL